MNKQTAVEWFLEQMMQYGLVPKGTHSDNVLFHKAKEMDIISSIIPFIK